jgi:hypothetical protein
MVEEIGIQSLEFGFDGLRLRERIFIARMTTDRKLRASTEGSKSRIYGT